MVASLVILSHGILPVSAWRVEEMAVVANTAENFRLVVKVRRCSIPRQRYSVNESYRMVRRKWMLTFFSHSSREGETTTVQYAVRSCHPV
jgi:hypothetical protein